MRWIVRGVVLALVALIPAAPAFAQPAMMMTQAESQLPVIVTTGEAVVQRAPDRAWVTIAAETRARTAEEAQRANADAMASVNAKIKSSGVGDDAVQTIGYDLQPEFDFVNGRQALRGYVARNQVQVRVDTLTRLGDVIGAAVASGATSVSGVRFDVKDRESAEREALRRAVADAVARADAAAAGARATVARVIRIEEQRDFVVPQPRPMMMSARAAGPQDASVPIEAGQIEIRSRVMVTSAIK